MYSSGFFRIKPIARLILKHKILGSHTISDQSLLLSTIILNDKVTSWPQLISNFWSHLPVCNVASDWPRTFLHPRCFYLAYHYFLKVYANHLPGVQVMEKINLQCNNLSQTHSSVFLG